MAEIIRLDIEEMVKRFAFMGEALPDTVFSAVLVSTEFMLREVVKGRMSGPRGAEGILGVVTGNARRSMTNRATMTKDTVEGGIGSPADYVRAHELGFHGDEHVRAHERRRLGAIRAIDIRSRTATKRYAPTAAQRRAGPIMVRAHVRRANIIAKHFIRDTVRSAVDPTTSRIGAALILAARLGRAPTRSEVASA
jgi:hypothetical protein